MPNLDLSRIPSPVANPLDLGDVATEWLKECPDHDYGMPEHGCACPGGDFRPVMARLVDELAASRERVEAMAEALRLASGGAQ